MLGEEAMTFRQRLGLAVMLFGIDALIAAQHSEFTGTLFILSKICELVGAAMMIVPVRRKQ
jgi:hypothetical protein